MWNFFKFLHSNKILNINVWTELNLFMDWSKNWCDNELQPVRPIITEQIKTFHDRPASLPYSGISETQSTRSGNKDKFLKHERLVKEWNKVRTHHDFLCFSSSTEAIWLPRPLLRIHFWEANGTLAAQNDFQRNCNRSLHSSRWQSHIRKVKWLKKCNYKQQKISWQKQEISSELSKCPNNPEKDTSS